MTIDSVEIASDPAVREVESESVEQRAQGTYRKLREQGLSDTDIMGFAGELLSLVAAEVREQAAAE